LKVAIVVHSGSHLHGFGVLSVGILCTDIWKHILNSGVVGRLNDHHWIVIDTSMSHMMLMVLQKYAIVAIILFQTFSHIKSLLLSTSINGGACRSIRLYVYHI
jgi:hypothetical protein